MPDESDAQEKESPQSSRRAFRFHQSRSRQPAPWPALRSAVWPARSARSWAESSVLSQEKPPPAAGQSFLLLGRASPRLLNAPNRAPQKSVPAVRQQRKNQHGDRLPQNRGNVPAAVDNQHGDRLLPKSRKRAVRGGRTAKSRRRSKSSRGSRKRRRAVDK